MNATKFHDDGNCLWHYKNQWGQHTKDPNDWYYTVSFETKDGGYLTGGALTCQYWESRASGWATARVNARHASSVLMARKAVEAATRTP